MRSTLPASKSKRVFEAGEKALASSGHLLVGFDDFDDTFGRELAAH
jgi:hypothetical protein